jgi:hypothetical protein
VEGLEELEELEEPDSSAESVVWGRRPASFADWGKIDGEEKRLKFRDRNGCRRDELRTTGNPGPAKEEGRARRDDRENNLDCEAR